MFFGKGTACDVFFECISIMLPQNVLLPGGAGDFRISDFPSDDERIFSSKMKPPVCRFFACDLDPSSPCDHRGPQPLVRGGLKMMKWNLVLFRLEWTPPTYPSHTFFCHHESSSLNDRPAPQQTQSLRLRVSGFPSQVSLFWCFVLVSFSLSYGGAFGGLSCEQ